MCGIFVERQSKTCGKYPQKPVEEEKNINIKQ